MTEMLAEKYVPHLRYDRREPYSLTAVGYYIHRGSGPSPSSGQYVRVEPGETAVEYAFFYDFDIQHLYDLEHVFVTIGAAGEITGVLGSFHGKLLNHLIPGEISFEGTHVIEYVQPGKHAFMPRPHYFQLAPDRDGCCNIRAGSDGFLIGPRFEGRLTTDRAFDKKVERFIRQHHSFTPSWQFGEDYPYLKRTEEVLMPWEELEELIVRRMEEWKRKIDEGINGTNVR